MVLKYNIIIKKLYKITNCKKNMTTNLNKNVTSCPDLKNMMLFGF